ncbi:MAG: A/G-specific adenine glycosylase [Deltaproteobacteria bacterium RBG_19FT_COMBO_52_11]|nr:MAG: A/G-specific adenine glycosylase [Deltaproteobacteria bacterium RBG_19FT_COMBO_52_11]
MPWPEKRTFQRSLLHWFSRHQRDLPWRKNQDPYRIMVSEFMLQQTRVETVLPYFDRFLKLFPTCTDLAQASLPKVLKVWAGLGYYARARHLHAAAQTIERDFNGNFPWKKNDLLRLPGFGPYTAGAVASIAFHEPVAALDGNVDRVFTRLLDLRGRESGVRQRKILEEVVEKLIPRKRASAFNQALMDLGALICIPLRPRCPSCPIKRFCTRQGAKGQKPSRTGPKFRKEVWAVALTEHNGRFLLHRREGKGLLAGLWQFPTVAVTAGKDIARDRGKKEQEAREALKKILEENFGVRIKIKCSLAVQEHRFTHIHLKMMPFSCSLVETIPVQKTRQQARWIKPSGLSRYPIAKAMQKMIVLLKNIHGDPPGSPHPHP